MFPFYNALLAARPCRLFPTLALAGALLCAAGNTKREYFSISQMPEKYPHPAQSLAALVQSEGKAKVNHFCVVGVRYGTGEHDYRAEVYWKENHTITDWHPSAENSTYTLLYSIRTYDLERDVIPSDLDFGGTNTIQDKEVEEILSACKRVGQNFVITKKGKTHRIIPLPDSVQEKNH